VANVDTEELSQSDKKANFDMEGIISTEDEIVSDTKNVVSTQYKMTSGPTTVPLYGVNRPFFHVDILSAVESATAILVRSGAIRKDE
jgi:hypothetical protein